MFCDVQLCSISHHCCCDCVVEEVLGQNVLRNRAIVAKINDWAQKAWLPASSTSRARVRRMRTVPITVPTLGAVAARDEYFKSPALPLSTAQSRDRMDAVNSILEANNAAQYSGLDMGLLDEELKGSESGTDAKRANNKLTERSLAEAFQDASRKKAGWQSTKTDEYGLELPKGDKIHTTFSRQTDFGQERKNQDVNLQQGSQAFGNAAATESSDPEAAGEAGAASEQKSPAAPKGLSREELAKQREEEIQTLTQTFGDWESVVTTLERSIENKKIQLQKLENDLMEEEADAETLRNDFRVRKRMFELLPDVENNLQELRSISAESAKKLMALATEWEGHRLPLITEYRSKKDELGSRKADFKVKVEKIQRMRKEMKDMIKDLQAKEERYKSLKEEYEKLPKNLNRGTFISRISEMVNKVQKHNSMINSHLTETREVQRNINSSNQKLGRTYAVTDELVFRDAKSDEKIKAAYKHMASMHQTFEQVMGVLEESQRTEHEKFLLEKNISTVQSMKYDLPKVQRDLKQVKAENKALAKALGLK